MGKIPGVEIGMVYIIIIFVSIIGLGREGLHEDGGG